MGREAFTQAEAIPEDDGGLSDDGHKGLAEKCLDKLVDMLRSFADRALRVRRFGSMNFEDSQERSMLKFEIGYIGVEAASLLLYAVLSPGRPWPASSEDSVHIWPAACVSIALRMAALPFRFQFRGSAHLVAALVLLVDAMLITSCHPSVSGLVWWVDDAAQVPDVKSYIQSGCSGGDQLVDHINKYERELRDYMDSLESLQDKKFEEHTMVQFTLQILVWYGTTFVLLFRSACVTIPLALVIFCTGALGVWNGKLDAHGGVGIELALLAFSMIVAVAAKARLESSQRLSFYQNQEKHTEAIHERVRRYAAEREVEKALGHDCLPGGRVSAALKAPSSGSSASALSMQSAKYPPSTMSAPAAVRTGPMMTTTRRAGECLPPDAVVWVEGQGMPVEVSSISAGQRVLCYDNLTQCPRYVDVMDARLLNGQAPWVSVTLSDGTNLTLTADHPTQPVRHHEQLPFPVYVPASGLQADVDSLMVLKMLPLKVKSVEPVHGRKDRRVALSLRQPDRHEVFASPSRASPGQEFSTMAIGSADIVTHNKVEDVREKAYGFTVKRTFIDVDNNDVAFSRSNSCPPSIRSRNGHGQAQNNSSGAAATSGNRRRDTGGRVNWADDVNQNTSTAKFPRLQRTWSDSDIASVTTMSSKMSSSPSDAEVLVAVGAADSAACVSELLEVSRSGLPSRGSVGHSHGQCQACIFENRWQTGESGQRCFKGALCERCHECHEPLGKKKRMTGAMRNFKKWQQRLAKEAEEGVA